MNGCRILVVDDEQDMCEILKFNLELEGYTVDTANSAEQAWKIVFSRKPSTYSLLLLDVMMNGMSGFELARRLKRQSGLQDLPIIFLTAKDTEDDIIHGLNLGADDYISKPFSLRECMARVKAVLRRNRAQEELRQHSELHYKDLCLDTNRKTLAIKGEPVNLTKTEYDLLLLLLSEQGQVFTRQQLIDRVWRKDVIVTNRTVDVNITRLRRKLGSYAANIKTRQGFGYYFEP